MLFRTVGIQEFAGEIDDRSAVPCHAQALGIGRLCNDGRQQIFLCSRCHECVHILGRNDNCHTLLRLGDRELRTVQTVILSGHCVEVNIETVCQLADRNGNAARTEVIAALDELCDCRIAEETLELALLGRIALLHLCAAGCERFERVRRGRTGRAAAAVSAGLAAEQDDDITRNRALSADILCRSRTDDRADLHALSHIARVIDLGDMTRRKTDLVAVGGVAVCRADADLSLRQLAGNGILDRHQRIRRAGDAHCLIDIASAGERVTDRTAEAGRGAAERLNLGRMVVGFVLEHEDPVLGAAVGLNLDFHGAGVDLLALVECGDLAVCFELAHCHCRHIHERDRLLASAELSADAEIILVGCADLRGFDRHIVHSREEGGVAAVIAPVGVDHADLGDGRVAVFGIAEVALAECNIVCIHRKTVFLEKCVSACFVEFAEAVERGNGLRQGIVGIERIHGVERCLTALDRVDQIALELLEFCIGERARDDVDTRIAHAAAVLSVQDLDALLTGIRTLIELSGEIFDREHALLRGDHRELFVHIIDCRLREDRRDGAAEILLRDVIRVIAVQDADAEHIESQCRAQVGEDRLCLDCELRLLFGVDAINCHCYKPPIFMPVTGASVTCCLCYTCAGASSSETMLTAFRTH